MRKTGKGKPFLLPEKGRFYDEQANHNPSERWKKAGNPHRSACLRFTFCWKTRYRRILWAGKRCSEPLGEAEASDSASGRKPVVNGNDNPKRTYAIPCA